MEQIKVIQRTEPSSIVHFNNGQTTIEICLGEGKKIIIPSVVFSKEEAEQILDMELIMEL